jgi:hypothetical protein
MAYTTIDKPTDYFNTVLYTGDGASSKTISGVGFQPDFTWIKNRDSGTAPHILGNIIQGYGSSGTTLKSDSTDAEALNSSTQRLINPGATSDGFTVGNSAFTNGSGNGIVAWNWLASNTTASNTDGSITSSVSANTTAGFSIVSFTGTGSNATVGHGLGTAPSMVIIKRRDSANDWRVGSDALTNWTKHINLNTTAAESDLAVAFNSTAPTSSVFSVGTSPSTNASGGTFIAYCFASIKGYSKIGSYTGNGSSDGSYIHLGFKPAFVMFKNTETTANWGMIDNKRDDDNVVKARLFPNLSDTESSSFDICDFTAQGFKLRTTDSQFNSAHKIIYMAFAESPFTTSTGIPTTAR